MAMRRLRVYTGPDLSQPNVAVLDQPAENSVRIPLGEVLPLLADAVASNRRTCTTCCWRTGITGGRVPEGHPSSVRNFSAGLTVGEAGRHPSCE
jgi:hypothetical protein